MDGENMKLIHADVCRLSRSKDS